MSGGKLPVAERGRERSATEPVYERERRFTRPRLLPTLAAIVAIVVCVVAGNWQRDRLHAKEASRAQFDAAARADPVPFAKLRDPADWLALRYLQVIATGEFAASRQILIDNKVHAGRAGYDVVTPLVLDDGRTVLVDRGWIAQGASRSQLPDARPPRGVVTVRGRVAVPSSSYLEFGRSSPVGPLWQNLDPARFAAATGVDVLPVVIEATSDGASDDGLVREWPVPDLGIDRHRIYMAQWYAFAGLAAALWLWFHRPRTARDRHD